VANLRADMNIQSQLVVKAGVVKEHQIALSVEKEKKATTRNVVAKNIYETTKHLVANIKTHNVKGNRKSSTYVPMVVIPISAPCLWPSENQMSAVSSQNESETI